MNSNSSRAASSGGFELKLGAHAPITGPFIPVHSLRAIARIPAIAGVPAIADGIIWLFHVKGTIHRELIGDQQPGIERTYTYTTQAFCQANSPLLPSGLLGPVTIYTLD